MVLKDGYWLLERRRRQHVFFFLRGRLILLTAIEIFIITFTYSLEDMAIEHYHYKNIIILYTETTRKVTLG